MHTNSCLLSEKGQLWLSAHAGCVQKEGLSVTTEVPLCAPASGRVCDGLPSSRCPGTSGHHRHFANGTRRRKGVFRRKTVNLLWRAYLPHSEPACSRDRRHPRGAVHASHAELHTQLTPTLRSPSHLASSHGSEPRCGRESGQTAAPVGRCLLVTLRWTAWLPY